MQTAVSRTASKIQKGGRGASMTERPARGSPAPKTPKTPRRRLSGDFSLRPQPRQRLLRAAAQLGALVHSFFIRGGVRVATFMFLAGGKTVIFFFSACKMSRACQFYKVMDAATEATMQPRCKETPSSPRSVLNAQEGHAFCVEAVAESTQTKQE